jgi:CRISPR/Cas system-associated protein endoribonuclease Cas2
VGNTSHFQSKGTVENFLPLKGIIQMIEIGSKQYSEIEFLFPNDPQTKDK